MRVLVPRSRELQKKGNFPGGWLSRYKTESQLPTGDRLGGQGVGENLPFFEGVAVRALFRDFIMCIITFYCHVLFFIFLFCFWNLIVFYL